MIFVKFNNFSNYFTVWLNIIFYERNFSALFFLNLLIFLHLQCERKSLFIYEKVLHAVFL
jgi:hypothetical protein